MKKKIFLSATFVAFVFIGLAQVPDAFNYQAVVRNNSGEVVANQNVSFQISILQGSESGTVLYSETHTVSTNAFGLVNLKVGEGTPGNGVFSPGGWGAISHFLKIEIDPAGGNAYTHLGTSELLSVPYAFHAQTVQTDMVDDADASPTNEIQILSLIGSDLTLSDGGGTVTLPAPGAADNWGTQVVESDATLSGNGTSGDPLGVVGELTDDQTLTLADHDLTISEGNTVTLPGDDWGTQAVESNATLSGVGTSGDPLGVVGDLTDDQTLTIAGHDLSISEGNTVTIPGDDWGTQAVVSNSSLFGNGTSGSPLGVDGDLTDDQTLTIAGDNLSISNGNSVPLPSIWSTSGSDIYYSSGNVGINTAPTELFHMYGGNAKFEYYSGSLSISTPGSWPGIIAIEQTGKRRDMAFRDLGINIVASTSSAAPGMKDGIWIIDGGNVGIQTWATGPYPLFVNERTEYGLAIHHESASSTWEIFSSSDGGLYLYHNTTVMGSFNGSSGVYTALSDRRVKKDIRPLNSSLGSVRKLRPSTYVMKSDASRKSEIGFVAQEVRDNFPELVYELLDEKSGKSIYTVNYNGIIVVAVKAIQEQQEIIEQQAKRIEALEKNFERLQKKMRRF